MVWEVPSTSTGYVAADGSSPANVIKAATDQAFLTGKDALFNVIDLLSAGSMWAFRTIAECEKELDQIERTVDGILPKAITHVGEQHARELLAWSRIVTELERIADLALSAAHQLRRVGKGLEERDRRDMTKMAEAVQKMIELLHATMRERDLQQIAPILRADKEIDRLRGQIFRRHLQKATVKSVQNPIALLFAAQALERAGDQATNIAEELYRLVSGKTLRHLPEREKRSKLGT